LVRKVLLELTVLLVRKVLSVPREQMVLKAKEVSKVKPEQPVLLVRKARLALKVLSVLKASKAKPVKLVRKVSRVFKA
jgi:hypothetical protein